MSKRLPIHLIQRIRIYRYAVYASLILSGFWQGYQTLTDVSLWLALLVVAPSLIHGFDVCWTEAVHGTEAVVTPVLLLLAGVPFEYVLAFSALAVIANVALWGFVSGSVWAAVMVLALTSICGAGLIEYQLAQLLWGVGLAVLVHVQAREHLDGHDRLKRRQDDILRFLPEGFDPKMHRPHERQWLTVAFVDLGGFTRAVETLTPEVTREVLNGFLGQVTGEIRRSGGSVGKFLGDGVLCTFAAYDAADQPQAARACLDTLQNLIDWLPSFNAAAHDRGCYLDFSLSMGVASGYCSVGEWGRGERLDFTVIGGPVNLACRLQQAVSEVKPAVPILLDHTTRTLLGGAGSPCAFDLVLKGLDRQDVFSPT